MFTKNHKKHCQCVVESEKHCCLMTMVFFRLVNMSKLVNNWISIENKMSDVDCKKINTAH